MPCRLKLHAVKLFLSTPSARRATSRSRAGCNGFCISIHALREEGDLKASGSGLRLWDFYPRPPRGGRLVFAPLGNGLWNFYPRPPRGGRPADDPPGQRGRCISIHALREEGDFLHWSVWSRALYFYPRPPRGGRLGSPTYSASQSFISIHALREEGDPSHPLSQSRPCEFLSTPSARRATNQLR